jgi:Raf kinase inhibitor-like YbhB/YbcL family protein
MRRTVSIALAVAAVAAPAGCGEDKVVGPPPGSPQRIALTSPDFAPGGTLPERFTCDGDGESPALRWRGVPAGARSLALLVEDPDAPGGTYVHWSAWDIPPTETSLPADADPPRQGRASGGDSAYEAPCPPDDDEPHRYVFLLYALRAPLELDDGASPDEVRDAIEREALARGRLVARFGR